MLLGDRLALLRKICDLGNPWNIVNCRQGDCLLFFLEKVYDASQELLKIDC